jgi:hypothetical protein
MTLANEFELAHCMIRLWGEGAASMAAEYASEYAIKDAPAAARRWHGVERQIVLALHARQQTAA